MSLYECQIVFCTGLIYFVIVCVKVLYSCFKHICLHINVISKNVSYKQNEKEIHSVTLLCMILSIILIT
jgi:hypothetical protein